MSSEESDCDAPAIESATESASGHARDCGMGDGDDLLRMTDRERRGRSFLNELLAAAKGLVLFPLVRSIRKMSNGSPLSPCEVCGDADVAAEPVGTGPGEGARAVGV